MNRFKKEIRKRGFKLESDFEYLPIDGLDSVNCNAANASYFEYYYCLGTVKYQFNRDLTFTISYLD